MSYDLDWLENEKLEKESLQESKKPKKISEKISPEVERLDDSKKLKIGSADLDLLSKSLDKTTGFDISNVHISQDDL